jgi:hypothetical protein
MNYFMHMYELELAVAKQSAAVAANSEAAAPTMAAPARSGRERSGGKNETEGPFGGSGLPLPQSCVDLVLSCLAAQGEPYGLVGPSLAARDIAKASLACRCVLFVCVCCVL